MPRDPAAGPAKAQSGLIDLDRLLLAGRRAFQGARAPCSPGRALLACALSVFCVVVVSFFFSVSSVLRWCWAVRYGVPGRRKWRGSLHGFGRRASLGSAPYFEAFFREESPIFFATPTGPSGFVGARDCWCALSVAIDAVGINRQRRVAYWPL